jgi:tetratricopeptide (TPR) repeat protein
VKITLLLCSFFLFSVGIAQNIPSLWSDFRNGSSSARVKACDELSRYYESEAPDTLKVLGEELFMYGIDEHFYPAIEQGKLTLADYLIRSGKTSDGIAMAKALLSNMEERGDDRMLSHTCTIISIGYIHQRDAKSSYHWSQKAIRYGSSYPDPMVKSEPLLALAESYRLKKQPGKAIAAFRKYISAIKPYAKHRSISSAYARMGDVYRLQGDLDKADEYFRLSMKYAKKSGLTAPMAHALNNLAIIYFEKGDTIQSRGFFEQAMLLREKTGDIKSIAQSYYNMGEYHFYISQYDKAFAWYKRSLEKARLSNLKSDQADALKALSMVAESTQDYKGANTFLQEFIALQEEMLVQNSADDEEIATLQQTIIRLESENHITNSGMDAGENGFLSSLKWEWFVIGILLFTTIYLLITKKRTPPKTS